MHSYLGLAAIALHKREAHQKAQCRGEERGGQSEEGTTKKEEEQNQVLQVLEGLATEGLDPCLNISLETRAWILEKLGRGRGGGDEVKEGEDGREKTLAGR
jgi:hypothetical protein